MTYSVIAIIYNPNSTGPSRNLAKDLKKQILNRLPKQTVKLYATKYARHGEVLAYDIAKSSKNPLIISSSGDGGYHEIINGAMKAQNEKASPTVGLLPGGNANDHYNNLHDEDIIDQIVNNKYLKIDLLRLTDKSENTSLDRYAHSYIGLGLTSWAGKKLTETKINPVNQLGIILKTLIAARTVKLRTDEGVYSYSSIIFSNVDVMAKVLHVSRPSQIDDGKFEVTTFKTRSRLKLIALLFKATIKGIEEDKRVDKYLFETTKKTLIQLDGEVFTVAANSKITIQAEHKILKSIV